MLDDIACGKLPETYAPPAEDDASGNLLSICFKIAAANDLPMPPAIEQDDSDAPSDE
jgi:hypothetical protein